MQELDEMRKLYKSGDYVCYFEWKTNEWYKCKSLWLGDLYGVMKSPYKLIHKKHSHIADEVIANPDVEVEYSMENSDMTVINIDFFNSYDATNDYRLAKTKQDFNGGHIVASKEAYDLLVEIGYKPNRPYEDFVNDIFTFSCLYIENNNIGGCSYEYTTMMKFKQFYINNHKLSWKQEEKENESINVRNNNSNNTDDINNKSSMVIQDTISIKDEQGNVYEFEKPEFECELFAISKGKIWGQVNNSQPMKWDLDGESMMSDYSYELHQIKKAWYEDAIKLSKGIAVIHNDGTGLIYTVNEYRYIENSNTHWLVLSKYNTKAYSLNLDSYRPATKQEVDSLYYEDKE